MLARIAHLKQLECRFEQQISPGIGYCIRLDGVGFRKFTRQLDRPFDMRMVRAMQLATRDLVDYFHASLGYTISDEITLIVPACHSVDSDNEQQHLYSGRSSKLISIASSLASVKFNAHLASFSRNITANTFQALFDARLFSLDNEQDALDALWWRQSYDGRRNVVNTLGQTHVGKILGMNVETVLEKLKDLKISVFEGGAELSRYDDVVDSGAEPWLERYFQEGANGTKTLHKAVAYGTFIKRALHDKHFTHPLTGEESVIQRRKYVTVSAPLLVDTEQQRADSMQFIYCKHIN